MSRAEDKALEAYPYVNVKDETDAELANLRSQFRVGFVNGYKQAMAEIEEKIAQVKKNGTWDGVDVDEFMKQFRGE